jgi:hypothetical protein
MKYLKISFRLILIILLSLSFGITDYGQIPDWYVGKPYNGKPQVIPGRIEFEYHDSGAFGVTFKTDYINAGPIKDCRPGETQSMSIDETNIGEIDPVSKVENIDKYNDGTLYPSEINTHSYYVGWTHPYDWTRFTVFVTKTDDYYISSTFAQGEETQIGFTLKINADVSKQKKIVLNYGSGGSWHSWRKFDNFTTVHLDSGLNMLEFYIDIHHLNYDYLEFTSIHAPATPKAFNTDALKDNLIRILFSSAPSLSLSKTDSILIKRGSDSLIIDSLYFDPLNAKSLLIRLKDTLLPSDNNLTISWPTKTIVTPNNAEGDSLAATKINNLLPAATPVLLQASAEKRLKKIYLLFSKKMKNPVNLTDSFRIAYNGQVIDSIVSVTMSKTDAKTIIIVPFDRYLATDTITISYIGSGYFSVDTAELQKFSGFPVENTPGEPPRFVNAYTNTNGSQVSCIFSQTMVGSRLRASDFILVSDDDTLNVKSSSLDNSYSWKMIFNVNPLINYGSNCYISYIGDTAISRGLMPLDTFGFRPIVNKVVLVGLDPGKIENGQNFSIYPNPAITDLNFKVNKSNGEYSINIYNEGGILVYKSSNHESEGTIPLTNFVGGLYFIKYTAKNVTETRKFSIIR